MSDSLRVFNNEEFGTIRTVMIDDEPWFVAADVCKALDIGNPSDAIRRLDADEVTLVSIEGASNGKPVNAVNEPGLYGMILGSRKPEAKAFKRWIKHDILPTLRKTGTYTARTMTPNEIIAAIAADNVEKERRLKSLEDGFHEAMEVLAEPPEAEEWRKKIYQKVSRHCTRHDLDYTETWEKLYGQLEIRAGCNLATLQTRRRNRARIAGATASAVNAINRLDCIAADKRLREIFTSIVKEFSARRILASSVAPETPADPYVFPALA